jgi:predicted nuclease of predicted toxin-antitoxin system
MIFIVDAHLPKSICKYFRALGHGAFHTSDLPLGNAISDDWILGEAERREAVVISKDSDFFHSFLLHRKPSKLIMVKVGNLKLQDLKLLFEAQAETLAQMLADHNLIEIHPDRLVVLD